MNNQKKWFIMMKHNLLKRQHQSSAVQSVRDHLRNRSFLEHNINFFFLIIDLSHFSCIILFNAIMKKKILLKNNLNE